MVAIQRSKGYDQRPSIPIDEIQEAPKQLKPNIQMLLFSLIIVMENLLKIKKPIEVGADLIAGSLIKNPGGGLAKIGGYIAGRI